MASAQSGIVKDLYEFVCRVLNGSQNSVVRKNISKESIPEGEDTEGLDPIFFNLGDLSHFLLLPLAD